jgi:hypothetical protein
MKKTLLLAFTGACSLLASEDITEALKSSRFTVDARAFYFDRDFQKPVSPDAKTFTVGGIAKIETGEFAGFSAALAKYGSYRPGFISKDDATGSSMLESGTNNNLSFIGESYIKYKTNMLELKIGKQRLSTPLINDHDLRLLPSVYSGGVLKTQIIPSTVLEAGWIGRYTGFASTYNTFRDMSESWGDKGLGYLYLQNNYFKDLTLKAQYVKALNNSNISVADYRYGEFRQKFGKMFIDGQYGANDYRASKDSKMFGFQIGGELFGADIVAVYNKILGNNFAAVESGAMYTDWQQGYGIYQPSEAVGGYIVLKPIKNMSAKIGRVNVYAKEGNIRDDFSETMFDGWYTFNQSNKLRLRYSFKDESSKANEYGRTLAAWSGAKTTGYEDRKDLRIIYYYSFAK